MIFFANKKDNEFRMENTKKYEEFIASLKAGRYEMRVRRYRRPRSLNQNSLYWEWLTIMAENLGYDCEELHSSLKALFLVDRSKKIPLVRSTTVLNTMEFSQYLDKVERQANELGITLPHPEEIT